MKPFSLSGERPTQTWLGIAAVVQLAMSTPLQGQSTVPGYSPSECPPCASWNAPRPPSRLFGNTYWVGTQGLGAILITSESGHILIDGGLPESAPLIEASIRSLGFRLEDIRVILNSHAHYDHAGGIAALQKSTGARVIATAASAEVLRRGLPTAEDPQRDTALWFPPSGLVEVVAPGDRVTAGPLTLVAHLTPGHSPGGTTWSWRSCDETRCADLVYADSQTPVSAGAYRYSDGGRASAFERGLDTIQTLPCDILLTPHPGASDLWRRVAALDEGNPVALFDKTACARYAESARDMLEARLARERSGG